MEHDIAQPQTHGLQEMVGLLKDWCAQNSYSGHLAGCEQMANQLMTAFKDVTDEIQQVALPSFNEINNQGQSIEQPVGPAIWGRGGAKSAKHRVLLVGHLDTVFPPEGGFTEIREDADHLYGPGVADMKGGLVVLLYTLHQLKKDKHPDLAWDVFIAPDEEIGSRGSQQWYAEHASLFECALIYEPSLDWHGRFAHPRGGSGSFGFVIEGTTAHVGRAYDEGKSAILKAMALIQALDELNQDPEIILNVGKIHGGDALNQVPHTCVVKVNVRVENEASMGRVLSYFSEIRGQLSESGCEISQQGGFHRPPKSGSPREEKLFTLLEQVCGQLNQPFAKKPTKGCCDGNNLSALGVPNIDTMGVIGANIHTDDEVMLKQSLISRTQLNVALLHAIANGGLR